jgi:transposase
MCPYSYYTAMRDSKDPRYLRLKMVRYANKHGVKPAARAFHTTPKTVRLWLGRFDGSLDSLADKSRAPHRRPRKIPDPEEARIVELKQRLPSWGPRRLKRDFRLPYAEKTIRRVGGVHGLTRRYRRRKHETKRCLREVKKQWRFLQQISVDTKDLSDIPEYWGGLASRRLPRYQYTARDVTTGLLFLGFADELALSYATLFAERIIEHLTRCGQDLSRTTWQSDNGSEFIGSWQAKDDSAFTKAIQAVPGQVHRTIPPGQHRFQADVETVHSLIETEFYMVETFANRDDFLAKAISYNLYFNLARENSGKESRTPWQLIEDKQPQADPLLSMLEPVFLDRLHHTLLSSDPGGYDVWALP